MRVSASEVVGNYVLPDCIAHLRETHPNIDIDIVVTNQVSNLLRRETDIALRMVRPTQSSVIAKKIADIPMGAFASKAYIARRGMPIKLTDLAKHDLLGMDSDDSLIHELNKLGVDVNRDSFAVRSDNQIVYCKLIEKGCGVGFMPSFVAQHLLNVEAVLKQATSVSLPVWLVVHREIKGNPFIRAVFDHLAEFLPKLL